MTEHTDPNIRKELDLHWNAILALEAKVELLETKRVTEQAVDRPTAGTFALIAELKAWRTEKWNDMKAAGSKRPAYSVVGDNAIQSIAVNLPCDRYELQQVHGIGPDKLALYGDELLAIVAKYRGGDEW